MRTRTIGASSPSHEGTSSAESLLRDWTRLLSWPIALAFIAVMVGVPSQSSEMAFAEILSTSVVFAVVAFFAAIIITVFRQRRSSIGVPFLNLQGERSLGALGCYAVAVMVKAFGFDSEWPTLLYVLTWFGLAIGGLLLLYRPHPDAQGFSNRFKKQIGFGGSALIVLFMAGTLAALDSARRVPPQSDRPAYMTNAVPTGESVVSSINDLPPMSPNTVRDIEVTLGNGAVRVFEGVPSGVSVAEIKDQVWSDYREIVADWTEGESKPADGAQ